MMTQQVKRYEDWKAPRGDGQLVIFPRPDELLGATLDNQSVLDRSSVPVQGVPLGELRRQMRAQLAPKPTGPLLATGHQTELYHPGVWVKNVLIDVAARKLDGWAVHLSVDTDVPKHLQIRWPDGSVPLTDDPLLVESSWSGQLASPSPRHLQSVRQQVEQAARQWEFTPFITSFFDSMRQLVMEQSPLAPALTDSLHRVDWELGLRHHALMASPLWQCPPYLVLVHHLLSHADLWASTYNAALASYRAEQGIHRPGHPMPDLMGGDDECESAFWLDDLSSGTRSRLMLHRAGGQWSLRISGDSFSFDLNAEGWSAADALGRFLRAHNHRVSPRALTLTLFMRLMVVDLFVHGIGGGRYDQVTDRIIARFFDLAPPIFAVTTATLYFPSAVGRQRVNLPQLQHQGHQLRHRVLGDHKMEMVRRMESLPRYSAERQALFVRMHRELEAARRGDSVQAWQAQWSAAVEQSQRDAAIFDRELFYVLQPESRLKWMIEQYQQAFE